MALPILLYAYGSRPPLMYTGGFGENTCADCHGAGDNTAGGRVTIGSLPVSYTPGASVPLTVTIQDSTGGRSRWGFELSARFRDGSQAGSFASAGNVGVQAAGGIQYAGHNPAASFSGSSYTYNVTWTPPASTTGGDVVFNAASVAGTGSRPSDHTYTTQAVLTAAAAALPPKVNAGGILNAASFALPPNNASSPGGLISIYGDNMASATLSASALPLPKQLGATQVLISGIAAPLFYVSKTQINAQVPFEIPAGGASVNVVVRVNSVDSAPEPLRITNTSPGIFTMSSNGTGPGAILRWPDYSLVTSAAPVKPNDYVMVYCTGLGLTNPPVVSGAAGNGESTTNLPAVTIGGKNAPVTFSGTAPGFAALYQLNVAVPDLPAGDYDVVISAGGAQSPAGVKISIRP